ncbi:phospholipase D family protein [Bacillus sp. 2205SS5-2]|uniref:phospholipase D family protein n=1 Tax=Bacillus sp. 2205SS5-2 TaxID=3109031 RepID=UPI0030075555
MKIAKNRWVWFVFVTSITVLLGIVVYVHTTKALPDGLSYKGDIHYVEDVDFLYDLSYVDSTEQPQHELRIFKRINEMILEAEEFVVIDLFLFNSYYDTKSDFPPISGELTNSILTAMEKKPDLKVFFITDPINHAYGSHHSEELELLEDYGVEVIYTDLVKLRDSNPIYSSIWRTAFQWFQFYEKGDGWLPNPMSKDAPDITFGSYLEMLNIKANHRKIVATDQSAMISSANPHDESGYHSNIAFEVEGSIISDVIESEQAVATFSEGIDLPAVEKSKETDGPIAIRLVTEGKIQKQLIEELDAAETGDEVFIGIFYLADRDVLEAIMRAADKEIPVHIVMDSNQNAFGQEKTGLPNIPVSKELHDYSDLIDIRWYNTDIEQYHTKMTYIKKDAESVIIGGSANYTGRNLNDFNLESDLWIQAPNDSEVIKEVQDYFDRILSNEDAKYTLTYEEKKQSLPVFKYMVYRLQKFFYFTTY